MAKILIVDDDPHIRELIHVILAKEGLSTVEANDGEAALSLLEKHKIDLIILDIMMPNMDGYAFCQEVRTYYSDKLPILMVTAKGETAQKVKGFDLGADDYLVKPFAGAELAARVRVLLKRYQINLSNRIEIGDALINRDTNKVLLGKESIDLPLKEFELLFMLASHPQKIFSREQLIEDIWGFDYAGDERTVDVHIKRLRQRFSDGDCPFKITTVRGLGYRLEAGS
ncbi:DNA-binding response regulator, OmpR family, contains REC and winged-helix (wHTH) domain [Fictibacillus solisalsi]|uniref:Heme response regulator HssR n=1 Tax=Fictibacillus solisalsi TaxID=459525 RepID=A0A1H0BEE8_9BACL|nr:response regulator transcription factor [Fictibacillus solisalsi]SDN44034.1 DNA-binding response regulator, OmpR family, contains REC and winged-helix (wHTH) domain [Fictibacillus solisalsi]